MKEMTFIHITHGQDYEPVFCDPCFAFSWHHPASPGSRMRTHWPWGRRCASDNQRKQQGIAHNPKGLESSASSSCGKAFLQLSLLQVSFPCRQLLLTCPGGVQRVEWYVLSFTSSRDISVLAERGSFFSLQWVKAKEATGFLNYSLIWPQSSPLHKYSLICSLGSQEKNL